MLTFIRLTGIRNRYQLSVLIVYRIFCQIIFQCFSRFGHLFCRCEFGLTGKFNDQTVFYGRVFTQVTFSELIPPNRFQNYLFVRLVNIEIAAMRSGYEGEIEITAVVVFFNSLICVNGKDNSSIPISRGSGEMDVFTIAFANFNNPIGITLDGQPASIPCSRECRDISGSDFKKDTVRNKIGI